MLFQTLLTMEKKFFQHQYISDKKWLNSVLHKDFKECGQSGKLYDKPMTMEGLLSCNGDRTIIIYNFECNPITSDCWMVHYITKSSEDVPVYRTSIWVKEGQLKLLFHQASQLYETVPLTKY